MSTKSAHTQNFSDEDSQDDVVSELKSLFSEWKEARISIDRFDNITVDLRKYGFSFITLLLSSTSIFLDVENLLSPLPLIIVPIVIAILTLSLFLADSYYQVLLLATIMHAQHLENINKEIISANTSQQMYYGLNLTNYLQDKVQKTNAHLYVVFFYCLFLSASSLLGGLSLWAFSTSHPGIDISVYLWIISSIFAVILIVLIWTSRGVSLLLKEIGKTEMLDNRFVIQKLYEKKDVTQATKRIASKIYRIYKNTDFKILTLGMGGLYFAHNLISELKKRGMSNVELISGFSERHGDEVIIDHPDKSDVAGIHILIVDDLVSSGITMQKAIEVISMLEAKTVRSCALIDAYKKRHPAATQLKIDFYGLRSSEATRFFVGSGLDGGKGMSPENRDTVRLLPYIGVVVASPNNSNEYKE
jgi:hypoxanthine phosphoribosyltransferase